MTFKINKSLFRLLILAVFYFTSSPKLSYAANTFGNAPTGQVIDIPALLLLVLNLIWPVVITIIVIFFIIAGFKFIMAQGNPEEIKTARRFLIWAIVGVIVIILSFSIVARIQSTFQISSETTGACCLDFNPDTSSWGSCGSYTMQNCSDNNGLYLGDGTVCTPTTCNP